MGSEQGLITVNDAIALLHNDLLSGPLAIQVDTSIDPTDALGADLTIPNLLIANAHFSASWGAQNTDHAIVLIAEDYTGAEYFVGLIDAGEEFANIALAESISAAPPTPTY